MMKKILMMVMLALSILAVGCTENLTTQELEQKIIEANTGLDSYSMDMEMIMEMTMDVGGMKMDMTTESSISGNMDRTEKKIYMTNDMTSSSIMGAMDFKTETYIEGNIMYIKMMDDWAKMEFEGDLWKEEDQIAQLTAVIKDSDLERLENQKIEGNDYYVIKVKPDAKTIIEQALQSSIYTKEMTESIEDMSDSIKNYTSTIWINKDTYIIEKNSATMTMTITEDNQTVDITSNIDVEIKDINKDFDITVPEEARSATVVESDMSLI